MDDEKPLELPGLQTMTVKRYAEVVEWDCPHRVSGLACARVDLDFETSTSLGILSRVWNQYRGTERADC